MSGSRSPNSQVAERKGIIMNKVLCYLYDGMADFEISLTLHRLRNTGRREIVSVSDSGNKIQAQSGLNYVADQRIDDIMNIEAYEALIIPGGPIDNEQNGINGIARKMLQRQKLVAAICFGPQFLGRAGVLDEYKYTTSCSQEKIKALGCGDPFNRANYVEQRVVADRNLITAKGYAFVDFAMAVCDYLNIFEDAKQRYEQMERIKNNA